MALTSRRGALLAALLLCGCLPSPRGQCAADADCATGPAGSFCAEGVCQGAPRGAVEPLPSRTFARSETVHVRARVDRAHGLAKARFVLGGGAVDAAREADGAFGADVPLSLAPAGAEGDVPLSIELRDDLDHLTALSASLRVDDRAPRVTLDAGLPAQVTRGASVQMRATVEDLSAVTVKWRAGALSGDAVKQADGSFLAVVETRGAAADATAIDVSLAATDALGNVGTAHAQLALTRLKFRTLLPAPYQPPTSIAVTATSIAAGTGRSIWILDRAGTTKGIFDAGAPVVGELATDGTRLFYARSDNLLCRMGSDGTVQLCCGPFPTLTTGPALFGSVAMAGTTGTSATSSRLTAMLDSPTCATSSTLAVADFANNSPAIAEDGTIYSGAAQAIVAAIFDGVAVSAHATNQTPHYRGQPGLRGRVSGAQPVLLPAVALGTFDTFIVVNPYNSDAPSPSTTSAVSAGVNLLSPTISPDGSATLATDDRRILSFNPNGSLKWSASLPDNATAAPVHGAGDVIYVGTLGGQILALSEADGSKLWSFDTGSPVRGPLAPGCDGLLYAATDAAILALVTDSPGLAASPWPRTGHDSRNTSDARRALRTASGACAE